MLRSNEITSIKEVAESNISDEEVIYNALGYSLFENLKQQNIIFEGWRDKKLFQIALSRVPAERKKIREYLDPVGLCHAKGVRDVPRVAPILELANRECIIVSDADQPAKQQQKEYESAKGYGSWYRYDQLTSDGSAITAEDFIKPEAFAPVIKKFQSTNPLSIAIDLQSLAAPHNRLKVVEKWFKESGVPQEKMKDTLNSFKTALFESLKPSHIEPTYFEAIEGIARNLGYDR